MKTSQKGIDLIKQFEGCRLKAYLCPAGIATIGFGHTGSIASKPVALGMTISLNQAEILLKKDLEKFEKVISQAVKVALTQNQFDALVSFVYNVGEGNFKESTLLRLINVKDPKASEQFLVWVKAGKITLNGLFERRKAEKKVFDTK